MRVGVGEFATSNSQREWPSQRRGLEPLWCPLSGLSQSRRQASIGLIGTDRWRGSADPSASGCKARKLASESVW